MKKISVLICFLVAGLSLVLTTNNVQAGTITGVMDIFSNPGNGWDLTLPGGFQIDDNGGNGEDYVAAGGQVGPGWGDQTFDAERLFWKRDGNTLSVGLQTGFNTSGRLDGGDGAVVTDSTDGPVKADGINYYAGDLALSFYAPGTEPAHFEYAVDYGLYTEDYTLDGVDGNQHGNPVGDASGINAAGLYRVLNPGTTGWNNNMYPGYDPSDPFAMEEGDLLEALSASSTNSNSNNFWEKQTFASGDTSFARIVSFDLASLGLGIDATDPVSFFAHWTMSCGNDEINGYVADPANAGAPVPTPEPATIALFGIGLAGLAGGAARRRFKKQKQL